MGGMMGGGCGMGGGGDVGNFWKSEEKRVMIRALDFTPEPDTTYRYRVRIVVFNPNHNRDDVSPGVDNEGHGADRPLERADRRGAHAGRRVRLRHGHAARRTPSRTSRSGSRSSASTRATA